MNIVGWLGVAMLAGALLVVAAGVIAMLPQVLSLRRTAVAFTAYTTEQQQLLRGLSEERQRLAADLEVVLLPARTLARWLRHPLVVALIESYRRRRARR